MPVVVVPAGVYVCVVCALPAADQVTDFLRQLVLPSATHTPEQSEASASSSGHVTLQRWDSMK